MADSLGEELPPPPTQPKVVGDVASQAPMPGAATPSRSASRWLAEIALPFVLGVVCAVSWAGALILAVWDGLPTGELRAAEAALLLVDPILIVVVAVALSRDFWRAPGRGMRSAPASALLALLMIVVGLLLAFLAIAPTPPGDNTLLLVALPFAAPGFSLGVALGYAWGARPRPTGAGVGLMGGIGFAAPLVALAVTLIIQASHPASACPSSRIGCGLAVVVDSIFAALLLIAGIFAVALSFIGGIIGAALRRRSLGDS